jgi:hypothetical protein
MMEYPKKPGAKSISIRLISDITVNDVKSGRSQAIENGPDKLAVTVSYNQGTFDETGAAGGYELQALWSFLARCRGQFNAFDFLVDQVFQDAGGHGGSGVVEVTVNSGFEVKLASLPAAKTILKAGNLIQFGNSPRAYILAQDLKTSAAGKATAKLVSPLIMPLPANTSAITEQIKLRMRLDSNTAALTLSPGRIHSIKSVGLIEVIE